MGVRRFKTSLSSQTKNYNVSSGRTTVNPSATGGTVSYSGGYVIHSFSNTGSSTFTTISGIGFVEYLIVAAGGGGVGSASCCVGAPGAGAGGYLSGSYTNAFQSYSLVVGSGSSASSGGDSSIFSLTSVGGGRGSGYQTGIPPLSGGSGAGGIELYAPGDSSYTSGRSGTAGQGNAGGPSNAAAGYAGGGGGAGSAGNGGGTTVGVSGKGGDGLSNSINGTPTYYSGGGGASIRSNYGSGVSGAPGGLGGGGTGYNTSSSGGTSGTSNTGGGGGGGNGGFSAAHTSGGSGIIIVRYLATPFYLYD